MPELNPQIRAILGDLEDLALNAKLIGPAGQPLAADLEALVAKHAAGAAPTSPAQPAAQAEETAAAAEKFNSPLEVFEAIADGMPDDEVIDRVPDVARAVIGLPPAVAPVGDEAGAFNVDDALDGLAAQIDEIGAEQMANARPQDLTLTVRDRGGNPVDEAVVRKAADDVKASLEAVGGPLVVGDTVVINEDGSGTITLATGEGNDGSGLTALGAGTDGFEADLPTENGGIVSVVATIGMPADAELAEQLGTLPADLPEVPEGQHRINGVLQHVEEVTGVRPQAQPVFTVTYSKDDGGELTETMVEQILAHPISNALRRLGASQHVETTPGPDASVKVAHFAHLDNGGDIDMATVAMGVTAYRGTFNFGGDIGSVSANAQAQLVDVDVPEPADW